MNLKTRICISLSILCCTLHAVHPQTAREDSSPAETARPRVALVLAGGSAWGLAHIGVIRYIEESGVPIDMVVGTSIGAIVGGVYSAGYSGEELYTIFKQANWKDLFWEERRPETDDYFLIQQKSKYLISLNFDRDGFSMGKGYFSGANILKMLDTYFLKSPSPVDFDALPRRFRAVATDVLTGERVVLKEGSLADSVRASMSIPGFFSPWYIDGRYLADGVMSDRLPINVAKDAGADIIIAVDLIDSGSFNVLRYEDGSPSPVEQNFRIRERESILSQIPNSDIYIPVDIRGFMQTDFDKLEELSLAGYNTAAAHRDEFLALKSLLNPEDTPALPAPDAGDPFSLDLHPATPLIINGAVDRDSRMIREQFYSLVGTMPDLELIDALYTRIIATRRYEIIRFNRDYLQEGSPLVISLIRETNEKNALRVSFFYNTSFASSSILDVNITPALFISGLSTKGSQLIIDATLFAVPGIDIEFHQPLGDMLSFDAFFGLRHKSKIQYSLSELGFMYNTGILSTGIDFSLYPMGSMIIQAGWSFNRTNDYKESDSILYPDAERNNHIARLFFGVQRFNSPIFSTRGFLFNLEYAVSLRNHDSPAFFQTIKGEGNFVLPVDWPVTVALRFKGGTDFSMNGMGNRAPFYFLPDIRSRWMFPGPLKVHEEIGSHALGFGLEIKYSFNWKNSAVKLPDFLLFHGAIGGALQQTDNIVWTDVLHWNASAGFGLRLGDAFGLAVRGGIHQGSNRKWYPYAAIDIGAIGLL